MAEQEQMEIPTELDSHDAAGLLDKLAVEPEEKPAAKVKDPVTGRFVKTKKEPEVEAAEGDAESEDGEEGAEADAEETPEGETKEEKAIRLLKVKLDGMEQDVPEEEVVKGYLRQSDYTRKTQELSEARKRFESEELPAVRQEREYYAEQVQRFVEAVEALTSPKEPDWMELGKTMSPDEFTAHYAQWKSNQAAVEKAKAEHARVLALHEQETTRERAARLVKEQEKLEAAIPDLKDPEKGKVLREDLMAYAKSIGWSDDDIGNVEDHRALVILNKARLYDESQKRLPKLQEKVEKAVAGLKPVGTAPRPKAKEVEMLKTRFKSDASVDSAAALLDKLAG